jgi:hypothetical protein
MNIPSNSGKSEDENSAWNMITDFLSLTCEGICEQLFQAKEFCFFSVSFWLQKTEKVWRIKTQNKKSKGIFTRLFKSG